MSYNFESDVSVALGQLLKTDIDYNVIIYVGRERKEFHAHSNILRCRSEIFNELLSVENIEKEDEMYIIERPSTHPQAFEVILT